MKRTAAVVCLTLCLAACGGGGSGGGGAAPAPPVVTLTGQVTFDFVPVVAGRGLDYMSTAPRPARGVTIELLQGGAVASSATTDASGNYSFNVPSNTDVALRVRAEMLRV